ncbi:hypothetical protein LshimejAT787_0212590 [Lyophyllum shimeji]|uniref:Uncharacterized protein n=1 Tax=Lyophyllum shimeji TaxID=47721 RepID=A0A9P3UIL0_LYOSH|nr:hypothetical protein LshimejAT787_0212590 [Lyophyllum shimeji]
MGKHNFGRATARPHGRRPWRHYDPFLLCGGISTPEVGVNVLARCLALSLSNETRYNCVRIISLVDPLSLIPTSARDHCYGFNHMPGVRGLHPNSRIIRWRWSVVRSLGNGWRSEATITSIAFLLKRLIGSSLCAINLVVQPFTTMPWHEKRPIDLAMRLIFFMKRALDLQENI